MFDNKNDNVATGPIRNNKRSSMKQINICTFNARSLRNKTAELSYFVNKHNIHILAISETLAWSINFGQFDYNPRFPGTV